MISLNACKTLTRTFHLNDYGEPFEMTDGQADIFRHIFDPDLKRVGIKAVTQYGKSDVTAMAVIHTLLDRKIKILIVAPRMKQSQIIMGYIIQHIFDNDHIKAMLEVDESLERLRRERSKQRITLRNGSEVAILTADARTVSQEAKSLMGFGADCVVKGTYIRTDKGNIEISELIKNKTAHRVWSFNHTANKYELQRIKNYQIHKRQGKKLYTINIGGSVITCTCDHRIWVKNKGYVAADNVKVGDRCLGYGLTIDIVFNTISIWLLGVKSVIKSFIKDRATSFVSNIISVVESVAAFHTRERITRAIKIIGLYVYSVASLSGQDLALVNTTLGKNTAPFRAPAYLKETALLRGKYPREKNTTAGKETVRAIKPFISGHIDNLAMKEYVRLVASKTKDPAICTGQTLTTSIRETLASGLGFVHTAINNMIWGGIKVYSIELSKIEDQEVYDLEVETNHNFFANNILVHNCVVIDESALIPEDMFSKVFRMVGGHKYNKLVQLGNPFPSKHFQSVFEDPTYKTISIDYTQAIDEGRFTQEYIDEAKRTISAFDFEVFYECKFPRQVGKVFRNAHNIANAIPRKPQQGHLYVIGVDLAKVQDYTVVAVYDRDNNEQVYQDRYKDLEWGFQKKRIAAIAKHYNNALLVVDATGIGDPIVDDLIHSGLSVIPFKLTNTSKKEMIEKMSIWMDQDKFSILPIKESLEEFDTFNYEVSASGIVRYQARPGFHDDIVIAHGLAISELSNLAHELEEKNLTPVQIHKLKSLGKLYEKENWEEWEGE